MTIYGFESIWIDFHWFSLIFNEFHWFSLNLIDFHDFSLIWMDINWFGSIWVWISGYLAVWISGYMDIWISGYLDKWIYGYMDIWIYGYVDVYKRWLGLTGGERAAALSHPDPPSPAYSWGAPPLKLPIDLMDTPPLPGSDTCENTVSKKNLGDQRANIQYQKKPWRSTCEYTCIGKAIVYFRTLLLFPHFL